MNLTILEKISRIASEESAAALSKMVGVPVEVKVHFVKSVSVDDLFKEVKQEDARVVITFSIVGDAEGVIALLFSQESALRVASLLLKEESRAPREDFTTPERAALEEVANVIVGSYLLVFSKELGIRNLLHRAGLLYTGTLDAIRAQILASLARSPLEGDLVGILFDYEESSAKAYLAILLNSGKLEKAGGGTLA